MKAEIEAEYMAERMKRKVHKKGPAPKLLGNERCQVCGQQANGFHYNVLSCEGCKGFFRRTIINGIEYVCKTGKNDCNLYLSGARQRCQKCRILRCLRCGMNPNYVRKRKEQSIVGPYEISGNPVQRPSVIVPMLSTSQEQCLQVLNHPWRVVTIKSFEWLDIKETNDVWEYFACMKGRIIRDFVLKIHSFARLPTVIRMELMSKTSSELCLLLMGCMYNRKLQMIQIDDAEIDENVIHHGFGFDGPLTQKMFYFFNRQAQFLNGRDDISLYSILAGIILFSPDKSTLETAVIQSYQDELFDLLQAYCERYRACDKSLVRELMRILMSLKELSSDIKDASTRRMITALANSIDKEKKVIDTMPYIKQEPGLTF